MANNAPIDISAGLVPDSQPTVPPLPSGFTLDSAPSAGTANTPPPPPGFTLDASPGAKIDLSGALVPNNGQPASGSAPVNSAIPRSPYSTPGFFSLDASPVVGLAKGAGQTF